MIGYYENSQKWWESRTLNKNKIHKASINCAKINSSSLLLLSGSIDFKAHLISIYIPEIDDPFLDAEFDKTQMPEFGTVLKSYELETWIECVNWSLNGMLSYISGNNSTITVGDLQNNTTVIALKHSPVTMIHPIDDSSFYAVTFDREILKYELVANEWKLIKTITVPQKSEELKSSNILLRLNQFDQSKKASTNTNADVAKDTSHLHSSSISSLHVKDDIIITTDLSGFVKYWKTSS